MYMHCNHIHCKNMTQTLLIYIKWQQRLCTHVATHIHHIYTHCEDMIQLLHIYMFAWCSKLINFSLYQINLHASQLHTLQRHNTLFAYIHRMTATFLRMRCNSYTLHTYIAKTWFSFCTSTRLRDAVNQLIFRFIESIYMHRNHIHCKNMTQSLLIYTEQQQRLYACVATNIQHSHSHCKDTIQLLRIYTSMWCSKSIDFSIFWTIYMHRKYIHCKDMTQSLLIYTEWQQRLCAHAATNIRHSHSHCKDTTQLLRTYTSVWCSKSIDFSIFWLIYMRRKYIDQNLFSSFSWVIIQWTWKFTLKWSTFIYINQSSSSSLSLMIIQTSWKLTSKWSAFTILSCLYDYLII